MRAEPATNLVNDVTGLNPKTPWAIARPTTQDELALAVARANGPLTVAGGRYSMGGQTAQNDALMVDLTGLDKVVALFPERRVVRVQAGITWRKLQEFLDPHDLSVSIMQTYSNFTVGGAISVNCHGRYMGKGPIAMSVRALRIMGADGAARECSRLVEPELFAAAIGGLGGVGIIVEAELDLDENCRVERVHARMALSKYREHFLAQIRSSQEPVFHNADLYPPRYERVNAVTWRRTEAPLTDENRLMPRGGSRLLEKYFMWAISETPLGKQRRELYVDPLLFSRKVVRARNCEASYDVEELEPSSRERSTYVLQEYFVPAGRLESFVAAMAEILGRHKVNMVNVSIRHAKADSTSMLTWARGETYALVLYHKQRVRESAKVKVGVWTRELVEAAIKEGGCHYLPYQPHASAEQFMRAYPGAERFFEAKRKLDPEFRFQGSVWGKYYEPWLAAKEGREAKTWEGVGSVARVGAGAKGEFDAHKVCADPALSDKLYMFLQNVFQMGPEDRMHALVGELAALYPCREDLYRALARQAKLAAPWHAGLTYALPSLFRQKSEMAAQIRQVLAGKPLGAHLEIGSHGRYASALGKAGRGPVALMPEREAGLVDVIERGGFAMGKVQLLDYEPLPASFVADGSIDTATCLIGLHHCPPGKLDAFVASVVRKMAPGGVFVLRDHDVVDESSRLVAAMAHEVFGAVLGDSWESIQAERRHFAPAQAWVDLLARHGLRDLGFRVAQRGDPTDNLLMGFVKP